jgi:hypothetical protein
LQPFRIVIHSLFLKTVFADPYLNIDAGTMSPFEHGEVFVLDDGGEVLLYSCAFQFKFIMIFQVFNFYFLAFEL